MVKLHNRRRLNQIIKLLYNSNETSPVYQWLPVATALLYQDDEVNIWENRLLKHMDGPLHTHDYDYWLAFAKGLTKKQLVLLSMSNKVSQK